MLIAYRRHKKDCRHTSRKNRNCECPIWAQGTLSGQPIRKSLGTANWQRAQQVLREWEAKGEQTEQPKPRKTIAEAWTALLTDLEARGLRHAVVRKYRLLQRQMQSFADARSIGLLDAFDLDATTQFRSEWKDGVRGQAKKLERLRSFFRFAQARKWIADNPAQALKKPKIVLCPTLPFTREEMERILAAADTYVQAATCDSMRRTRALVLLMRYSGLRIGDAVGLETERVKGDRLFLRTQKTGVAVNLILPDFVVQELQAIPHASLARFFWDGESSLESATRGWHKRLTVVFRAAKIANARPHRFRDTFAVELLLAGVPMERVSILLGHQSVKITEQHYAPWVPERQSQLEADLRKAWAQDPLAQVDGRGTRKVVSL